MAKITQQQVPGPMLEVLNQAGIKIKQYKSAASFERDLSRFCKRNHVLHLSTSRSNTARSTPLEYRFHGMKFYILSEGGVKFENLKHNKQVSFSIAEPYNSEEDYWSYKGIQAWGTAKIYSKKEQPKLFAQALKKMNIGKTLKNLGMKELPPQFNYRIIELTPDRIKYGNPREGIFRTTWERK